MSLTPVPLMQSLSSFYDSQFTGARFTARELEVGDCIEKGFTNKEIAQTLSISEETVKRHLSNMFDKSGMNTRLELALYIMERSKERFMSLFSHDHFIRFFKEVGMSYKRQQIIEMCQKYGPQLRVPEGIDPVKLMWAISGAESSFGQNCEPRHEPGYDLGGYYERHSTEVQRLIREYGHAGACSYGPWQVLIASVPKYSPAELQNSLDKAAEIFVLHMNGFVFGFRRAHTIQQIAETYNSGDFSNNPLPGVLRYAGEVAEYYRSAPLPQ